MSSVDLNENEKCFEEHFIKYKCIISYIIYNILLNVKLYFMSLHKKNYEINGKYILDLSTLFWFL